MTIFSEYKTPELKKEMMMVISGGKTKLLNGGIMKRIRKFPISRICAKVSQRSMTDLTILSFLLRRISTGRQEVKKHAAPLYPAKAIFLILLIACVFMPFQQAVAGDSLTPRINDFHEKRIVPILKKASICTSMINCRDKEIVFCGSTQKSTFCNFYGITDDKIMKEIIIEIMNSNTLIRGVAFFRSTYRNKGFFEEPIMLYSNKLIGEK